MPNILDLLIGNKLRHPEQNQNGATPVATANSTDASRKSAKKQAERVATESSRDDIDDALARENELANIEEAKRKARRRDRKSSLPFASQADNDHALGSSVAAQNADLSRASAGALAHIGGLR